MSIDTNTLVEFWRSGWPNLHRQVVSIERTRTKVLDNQYGERPCIPGVDGTHRFRNWYSRGVSMVPGECSRGKCSNWINQDPGVRMHKPQ
jgi:hypothetical protein